MNELIMKFVVFVFIIYYCYDFYYGLVRINKAIEKTNLENNCWNKTIELAPKVFSQTNDEMKSHDLVIWFLLGFDLIGAADFNVTDTDDDMNSLKFRFCINNLLESSMIKEMRHELVEIRGAGLNDRYLEMKAIYTRYYIPVMQQLNQLHMTDSTDSTEVSIKRIGALWHKIHISTLDATFHQIAQYSKHSKLKTMSGINLNQCRGRYEVQKIKLCTFFSEGDGDCDMQRVNNSQNKIQYLYTIFSDFKLVVKTLEIAYPEHALTGFYNKMKEELNTFYKEMVVVMKEINMTTSVVSMRRISSNVSNFDSF